MSKKLLLRNIKKILTSLKLEFVSGENLDLVIFDQLNMAIIFFYHLLKSTSLKKILTELERESAIHYRYRPIIVFSLLPPKEEFDFFFQNKKFHLIQGNRIFENEILFVKFLIREKILRKFSFHDLENVNNETQLFRLLHANPPIIPIQTKSKKCGHSCELHSTEWCCHCSDERNEKEYFEYIDGIGNVAVARDRLEKFLKKNYCQECRRKAKKKISIIMKEFIVIKDKSSVLEEKEYFSFIAKKIILKCIFGW